MSAVDSEAEAAARGVGPTQRRVLLALATGDGVPRSAAELAGVVAMLSGKAEHERRHTSEAERVANTLRSLKGKRMAVRVGWAGAARTWELSPFGRRVLDAEALWRQQ